MSRNSVLHDIKKEFKSLQGLYFESWGECEKNIIVIVLYIVSCGELQADFSNNTKPLTTDFTLFSKVSVSYRYQSVNQSAPQ